MEINADKVVETVVNNALLYALVSNDKLNSTEILILQSILPMHDEDLIVKKLVEKFNHSGNGKIPAVKELRRIDKTLSLRQAVDQINSFWVMVR